MSLLRYVSVCPKLCCVAEQNSLRVPAVDPARLIKWFIGVVVIGVAVNMLSGFVVARDWAWLPPAVFVAALFVAVPSTGLLRRERYGTRRARAMALLALTGYLAVVVWGSVTGWPLALMILSVAYLWEAGVMLTWPTLRSRADLDHVAVGAPFLLVGSAFLLLGISNALYSSTLGMIAGWLVGVAALLLGVAVLVDKWTLVGVPFVLFGVAAVLAGIAAFLDGWTVVGVALLLGPVTALLLGLAFLLDRSTLVGVPFLLCAVAAPLSGVAALLAGWTLMGVALLLFGVAFLLVGVAAFLDGWTLVGLPFLLVGIAAPLGGVALLYCPELPRRLVAWLTKRDDLLLVATEISSHGTQLGAATQPSSRRSG